MLDNGGRTKHGRDNAGKQGMGKSVTAEGAA